MTKEKQRVLNLNLLIWLAVSLTLVVLPHTLRIPGWISVMYVALLTWRFTSLLLRWPLANRNKNLFRVGISLLALGTLFGIYISYNSIIGRDPGVALLVVLAGFKILEAQTERDAYVLICLGYILIITNFFYSESIPIALFMTLATLVLTSCFVTLNDQNNSLSKRKIFKLAGSILILSIPIMLVLFVFFPRISGPLWRMPQDAYSAKTGISDHMSPGSISQLLRSDALAFRVEFDGASPTAEKLYWRGPVLWHSDGYTWTRNNTMLEPAKSSAIKPNADLIKYHITLEASNKNWLFGLEMIRSSSLGSISHDAQLISQKIRQRIRYSASSSFTHKLFETDPEVLNKALQLEPGFHPRARALAESWKQKNMERQQIIDTVLAMFSEQAFYYTLQPPLLNVDPVDQFLFDSKQGFCEHYASAFVVLMRAAGIPARIVTGYQGASYNPLGNYFNVYQRDAHAWAEVYLDKQGWTRVDPTAAVSPARILQGIENALPELISRPIFLDENSLPYTLMQNLRNSWDTVNYRWNLWVIGYGPKRQTEFMKRLGIDQFEWRGLITMLVTGFIGIGIFLLIAALILFRHSFKISEPVVKLYNKFCKKMAGVGYPRFAHEGPADFCQRICINNPSLKPTVTEVTETYISIRYASDLSQLKQLERLIRAFKPVRAIN